MRRGHGKGIEHVTRPAGVFRNVPLLYLWASAPEKAFRSTPFEGHYSGVAQRCQAISSSARRRGILGMKRESKVAGPPLPRSALARGQTPMSS